MDEYLTPTEVVKCLEEGKKVLYAIKGTSYWQEVEITHTGFSLNFSTYNYKLKK